MSAGRHAHPIDFTVRVSRDKFDRDAGSLVLQPSLVTVNGEVFVLRKDGAQDTRGRVNLERAVEMG